MFSFVHLLFLTASPFPSFPSVSHPLVFSPSILSPLNSHHLFLLPPSISLLRFSFLSTAFQLLTNFSSPPLAIFLFSLVPPHVTSNSSSPPFLSKSLTVLPFSSPPLLFPSLSFLPLQNPGAESWTPSLCPSPFPLPPPPPCTRPLHTATRHTNILGAVYKPLAPTITHTNIHARPRQQDKHIHNILFPPPSTAAFPPPPPPSTPTFRPPFAPLFLFSPPPYYCHLLCCLFSSQFFPLPSPTLTTTPHVISIISSPISLLPLYTYFH